MIYEVLSIISNLSTMEVNENTFGNIEKFHVTEYLCLVHWIDFLNSFYFNNDEVVHKEIKSKTSI